MKLFNAMAEKEMVKVKGGGILLAFLATLLGLGAAASGATSIVYTTKCK